MLKSKSRRKQLKLLTKKMIPRLSKRKRNQSSNLKPRWKRNKTNFRNWNLRSGNWVRKLSLKSMTNKRKILSRCIVKQRRKPRMILKQLLPIPNRKKIKMMKKKVAKSKRRVEMKITKTRATRNNQKMSLRIPRKQPLRTRNLPKTIRKNQPKRKLKARTIKSQKRSL